ncbi:RNA polymerase sigma factor SigZ [Spirosoma flavus]
MILGYLRKYVKNEPIAQDISQDIFLKVYRLSQQPHYTVVNVRSWLFQLAHNAMIDHYRQPKTACLCASEVEQIPHPKEGNTYQEMADYVRPLLRCLPDAYALPLAMDLDGVPQKEIAQQLQLDLPTTKSRIQRSRKKMHGLFYECFHLEVDPQGRVESFAIRPDCVTLQAFLVEQQKKNALPMHLLGT